MAKPSLLISINLSIRTPLSLVRAARDAAFATWVGMPASRRNQKLKTRRPPFRAVIAFVGEAQSRTLNFQYRKKDRATDVLSFSRLGSEPFPGEQEFGELVLCLPVGLKQAVEYGVSPEDEVRRLTVHGVLHLFGYDHETNRRDAKEMFALQEKILKKLTRGSLPPGPAGKHASKAKASPRKSKPKLRKKPRK